MILYHGTNQDIDSIDLSKGMRYKDFGQGFYLTIQIGNHTANIQVGVSYNHPRVLIDNALGNIEDAHDDIPGIGHDQHGTEGLEYPLEEHPGINVVQIIPFCHKLNQLITHNKGQDHTGNGYDHRFGQVLDHGKDATVPALRRLSHFTRDLAYFGIHRIEHTRQVAFDPFREQPAQPLVKFVEYAAHKRLSPAA